MDKVQTGRRVRRRRRIQDLLRRAVVARAARPGRGIGEAASPLFQCPQEIPDDVVAFIMQGHRMFRPELIHEALYRGDGDIEPAMLLFYEEFLTQAQIDIVRRDLMAYAATVPDDVFGLDPNRYPQIRPGQVVKFDNPIGKPVFVFASRVEDDRVPAAKLAVCVDATGPDVRYDFVLDDTALSLWGYTAAEMETLQRAHSKNPRDRRPGRKQWMSFFMSLFSPASASVIATVNLCSRYFLACNMAFEVEIRRRDGRLIPSYCVTSNYVHNFYAHLSVTSLRPRPLASVANRISTIDTAVFSISLARPRRHRLAEDDDDASCGTAESCSV